MLRRRNIKSGRLEQLSDKELKNSIFKFLGLDPDNPADQLKYKRDYNVFYLRVRNYNTLINPADPVKANEALFRILEYNAIGKEVPQYLQTILTTPAQSGKAFKARASVQPSLNIYAINAVERDFAGLFRDVPELKERYEKWKYGFNTKNGLDYGGWVIYVDKQTGEVISKAEAEQRSPSTYIVEYSKTVEEVKKYLNGLAKNLRAKLKEFKKSTGRNKKDYYGH